MPERPAGRRRSARIAVLKPDFGAIGGFERVVVNLEAALRGAGHQVTRLTVDNAQLPNEIQGLRVPPDVWDKVPEYFRYLTSREAFDRLDTRRYDAVISTQPPSFSHQHPRHLAVFYHHHRVFYDLEAVYLAAGFARDPEAHQHAAELVRRLDQPRLQAVTWFLAGSDVVRHRLAAFNGVTNASVLHAGIGVGDPTEAPDAEVRPGTGAVLCVGRHEFPKRTELAVAAAHVLAGVPVAIVGTGGRETWARSLDHRLTAGSVDAADLTPAELWCNSGSGVGAVPHTSGSPVSFLHRIDDAELERLFAAAPCVIAPAYDEDYGLTAIEAMRHGRPVIVCRDGGGLAELVTDGVEGLVVDPTPVAIAEAVERLLKDPELAVELGRNGIRRAGQLTWANAHRELFDGLDRVLG